MRKKSITLNPKCYSCHIFRISDVTQFSIKSDPFSFFSVHPLFTQYQQFVDFFILFFRVHRYLVSNGNKSTR